MTTNEPPNQLEWSIRARSRVDSGQWDWGPNKEEWARISQFLHSATFGSRFGTVRLGHYMYVALRM